MDSVSRREDARLVDRVRRICARAHDPLELLAQVAAAVRNHIPYVSAGWLVVDPDTLLITGVYEEDVPREMHLGLIQIELSEDDVTKFIDLARSATPAAALSAATCGHLDSSARWSRIYQPAGFGDELRTVFRTGSVVWGQACLTRAADDPWYTTREVDLIARISPHVAHGIRAGLLLQEVESPGRERRAPGLVVLDETGEITSATPEALAWLGPVHTGRLGGSVVVHEVAAQARALADGDVLGPPAMARAQAVTGEWLLVRGTRLDGDGGRTAVVLEPASRSDIAPLLVHLHGLTRRELEVTQLLVTGMSTRDIARELWITPKTLRGHVKAIFAKLGIGSRAELFASLSHEPQVRSAGPSD